ncbi:hypothetical protein [Paracoccus sp. (in: a-proteobacteria)]|uniref:hypothetical protein n=1 Tax=Paracoccus sp. TaxID=267 RepID=UPI0035B30992
MSGGTQAGAGAITLVCPEKPDPAVTRLCGALSNALREDGYQLDAAAPVRLVLEAQTSPAGSLRARLVVEQDGSRQLGEKAELSVMDRRDIPPEQIDSFARDLLAYTPLPKP